VSEEQFLRIREFCHFWVQIESEWLVFGTNELAEVLKLAIVDTLRSYDMPIGHKAKDLKTNKNQHISVRKLQNLGSKSGFSGVHLCMT